MVADTLVADWVDVVVCMEGRAGEVNGAETVDFESLCDLDRVYDVALGICGEVNSKLGKRSIHFVASTHRILTTLY